MWDKIKDYFQGYTRYHLYYSKLRFLLKTHIVEQFEFRISIMDDQCLFSGSCKIAFVAPLIFNAPIFWKLSHLKYISAPVMLFI